MALTLGQLASGAGAVSVGMREAEEAERVARQNQLKIQEQNRANQAAKEIQAARAGLQVPGMPSFAGGTGGQQFTSSFAPSVPQTQQPAAQAYPVNMQEPQAEPIPAITPATQRPPSGTTIGPATYPGFETPPEPAATPAGRDLQKLGGALDERQERVAILDRMDDKYRSAAKIPGLFMSQTDEERQQAKDIMDQLPTLSLEELRTLEQTGQLPPKAEPRAGVKEPAAPAAPAAAKSTTAQGNKPTKRGATFDATKTPYDDLIAQSAQQYGVDPIILKRLLGTESEFKPSVVSGDKRDYGIAQINQVHLDSGKVTREQALDPNFAIPFAAELLADNLRRSNGDYTAAILMYKGAKTKDGIASVAGSINDILAGTNVQGAQEIQLVGNTPAKTADKVASAAAAPAASGLMFGPSSVAGGAQNPGVQSALLLRQTLANEYEIYNRNRMFSQADDALAQIAGIDLGLYKAQADQGIYELENLGDASRAMSVLSQFTGIPTQALDRGDGTYDLYTNGRVSQTAVPVDKLSDLIRTRVDKSYREQKAELAAAIAKERAEAATRFGVEEIKGAVELRKEAMKQNKQRELNLGNGQALIAEPDGSMYIIDAATIQQQESPQGVTMPPTTQKILIN